MKLWKAYLAGTTVLGAIALAACDKSSGPITPAAAEDDVAVYFSPDINCEDKVTKLIKQAAKSVWVQAYSFRSESIAKALVAAKKRGVDVKVIIDSDKAGEKDSEAKWVSRRGIPTFLDDKHSKAHNKVVLIDSQIIVTGSYNFLPGDDNDDVRADNLLVIVNHPKLMAAYSNNFQKHLAHSELKD